MNNNGYSLIELIIVMAIISILSVLSFNGIQYINYGNSKKVVSEIDKSMTKVRMESMTQMDKTYALVLSKEEDGYYIYLLKNESREDIDSLSKGTIVGNKKKIGNKDFVITYNVLNQTEASFLDESNPLIIRYKGNNGSFASDYTNITISNGSNVSQLNLVKKTGKHFLVS